jgi:hypothetical protein
MSEQLGVGNRSNAIYYRMSGGKVTRNAMEGEAGAVKVEKMKEGKGTGEYRMEIQSDTITGYIVGFRSNTHPQWGTTLSVIMDMKDGKSTMLQMKEGDRYWRALLMRLPNIDTSKPVKFKPYDWMPPGENKRKIGVVIEQGGVKVPPAWTRENPGQLPPPTRPVVKGKETYDFYDQDQWLINTVLLPIATTLGGMSTTSTTAATENPPDGHMDDFGPPDDNSDPPPF